MEDFYCFVVLSLCCIEIIDWGVNRLLFLKLKISYVECLFGLFLCVNFIKVYRIISNIFIKYVLRKKMIDWSDCY